MFCLVLELIQIFCLVLELIQIFLFSIGITTFDAITGAAIAMIAGSATDTYCISDFLLVKQ